MKTRVLVPSGALGLGYDKEALERGLRKNPDIIAIDGGSTDSGPSYLGRGISKYSRESTKLEWKILMEARQKKNIPLLIGTAGTCGTNSSVDWFLDITKEIAKELNQTLKIVVIKCSQRKKDLLNSFQKGKITELPNAPKISEKTINDCTNVVALAGVEQIIEALKQSPDIIIAGRTTDTAVIAALPIMKGITPGIAWHGAKIAECGALCTTDPLSGVVLVEFQKDNFTIEAMAENAMATPRTISAHMLYENSDPYLLYEPGGALNVLNAKYTAINKKKVMVSGAQWVNSKDYTVKLEGTVQTGFQNVLITILRKNRYVKNSETWIVEVTKLAEKNIQNKLHLKKSDYSIENRLIGKNASFGELETSITEHFEIGIMTLVTAKTQETTDEVSRILNPILLHHPLTDCEELPTFAFPFSPADISRGPIYEFCLNHVLSLKNPMEVFDMEVILYG